MHKFPCDWLFLLHTGLYSTLATNVTPTLDSFVSTFYKANHFRKTIALKLWEASHYTSKPPSSTTPG